MRIDNLGFLRVGVATPHLEKADPMANGRKIIGIISEAISNKVGFILFPPQVITSSSCGPLFNHKRLIDDQLFNLEAIAKATEEYDITIALGYMQRENNKLIPTTAIIQGGEIVFEYEAGQKEASCFDLANDISIGFDESCDIYLRGDVEAATVGQTRYIANEVAINSNKNANITLYAGENGIGIIAENGKILEGKTFYNKRELIFCDVDLELIHHEKLLKNIVKKEAEYDQEIIAPIEMLTGEDIIRDIRQNPFEPETLEELYDNCEDIFEIQSDALAERLKVTHISRCVVGISGGLDSTLALLVSVYAHKKLGRDAKDIIAITMPGFGTTDRTYDNALSMMKSTGAIVKEISIVPSVTQHFKDIDHDINNHDTTYENAQARERTQILMDVANGNDGLVVGTGDLSEEALGWCTFNGDHMAMYNVNAGVPKTVIKHIVRWFIDVKLKEDQEFSKDNELLAKTLQSILETPISPELLPPDEEGNMTQKTEDKVGPYELHDFFIFHTVRYGVTPEKLKFLASKAFEDKYDEEFVAKWLKVFYKRFFTQQFKRSCAPDSPKIGTVDLAPSVWNMPSDLSPYIWLKNL